MKVFPTLPKDETFSLSELAIALELVRSRHVNTQANRQADEDAPDEDAPAALPGCSHCMQGHQFTLPRVNANAAADNVAHDAESNSSSETSVTDSRAVTAPSLVNNAAPVPNVTATTPLAAVTTPNLVDNMAPITPIPRNMDAANQAATSNLLANTSVSQRWYVITAGRETGVFQGWHNVHVHVIGVPGACFGRCSSRSAAEAAYAQALNDGSVSHLPL